MLITNAEVAGCAGPVDVRCAGGMIVELGTDLPRCDDTVLPADGGALLPGLHDHHIHLFALAAAAASVNCGPPLVFDRAGLCETLRSAGGDGWLRGVGYHESVAGELRRDDLDKLLAERPVRVQHRSGKLWMLNSAAVQQLSLHRYAGLRGLELDARGVPTGRLFRLDSWLRQRLIEDNSAALPSLAAVSSELASYGVTGVTDASPHNGVLEMHTFNAAVRGGQWLQKLRVMGTAGLALSPLPPVERGERKILLDEDRLPGWDFLLQEVREAHQQDRSVAVHCVTPAELVLTLAVLREAGIRSGDRIEHGSLIPTELLSLVAESGVRVVTQPGFVRERGEQYLDEVPDAEHGHLYRLRSLLDSGIPLAGSTDAPYGSPDPWQAMRAAVDRRTDSGRALGLAESLAPEQALALFTAAAGDAGGQSRSVRVGAVADLCLMAYPWQRVRKRLNSADVTATVVDGELIYQRHEPLDGANHVQATDRHVAA